MKPVLAILTADLHLRESIPACRTDDYLQAMKTKLEWLSGKSEEYDATVIVAGDLFDHWKATPFLICFAFRYLPKRLICVAGQHDLPQHSLEQMDKSAFGVLLEADRLRGKENHTICTANDYWHCFLFHWGQEIAETEFDERNVAIAHQMVWHHTKPYPDVDPQSEALRVLRSHPGYQLIVTGDNHQSFAVKSQGRLLINPGSMMRMRADQADYKPRIYLWHGGDDYSTEDFPIEPGVVVRDHIERKEEREQRITAFVSRLVGIGEVGLSFRDNLTKFMRVNHTRLAVKKLVETSLEGVPE